MKQLDPKAVWLFFCSSIISAVVFAGLVCLWVVPFFVEFDFESDAIAGQLFAWFIALVVIFLVIAFFWAKLTYHFYRYELTDLGFRKESGVIYKKYVTIPYARIQNVDISRGIIARLLGLSDVMIQTAGSSATVTRYGAFGAGAEGRLPAVAKADAEVLRDELIRRATESRAQGI